MLNLQQAFFSGFNKFLWDEQLFDVRDGEIDLS